MRQLLGREQPTARAGHRAQRGLRRQRSRRPAGVQSLAVAPLPEPQSARCSRPPSWDTSGQRAARGGKHQALQHQAIALHPPPIATLGPRRLGVHVAQPCGNAVLLSVPFMPQRALRLVHAPING